MGNVVAKLVLNSVFPVSNNNNNNNTMVAQRYNSQSYSNQGYLYGLPTEIRKIIFNFVADEIISVVVQKAVFSKDDIKGAHPKLVSLSEVCIEFNAFSQKQLTEIKTIFQLFNKYSVHNNDYLTPGCGWFLIPEATPMVPCGNPQLLDLLSSGFNTHGARHSCKEFTKEQEDDMKTIIKLTPRSLLCNIGSLKNREFITPFIMACFNPNIPVETIEFLLKNGAEPNSIFSLNGQKIHFLTDLKRNNPTRYEQLLPILTKYGSVEVILPYSDENRYIPIKDSEKE